MQIDKISEELQGNITPQRLSDIQLNLSAEYAYILSQLEAIVVNKPLAWKALRQSVKSDKQADMLWDETENGRNEIGYKIRLKALEKLISAIKTSLRHKQFEINNQY